MTNGLGLDLFSSGFSQWECLVTLMLAYLSSLSRAYSRVPEVTNHYVKLRRCLSAIVGQTWETMIVLCVFFRHLECCYSVCLIVMLCNLMC